MKGFELLIVDNNSSDETASVVCQWQKKSIKPIRYVCEKSSGIAYARNRALKEAQTNYIAFVDDDAWPESDWLAELFRALSTAPEKPACVVGKVTLDWAGPRPSWIPELFDPLLCAYDQGTYPHYLSETDYLLTTNVLFHRVVLLDLGGFRPYLGRKRGQMLGGEDNDIHQRLIRGGYGVYYQPSAIVHHAVPPERRSYWYLVRRMFWDGATQPLMALSQAEAESLPYSAQKQVWLDLRRTVRFMIELVIPPQPKQPLFDRFLALIQRLGRLRSHILIALRSS